MSLAYSPQIFYADAVLFDMVCLRRIHSDWPLSMSWTECLQDGTLTDSISAVEAAWGKVAQDIGQDPTWLQLPMASVPSITCLTSNYTSRSTKWIAKSPGLKNPPFSSPTHTGFMTLVLVSEINLVPVHRLLSNCLMSRVSWVRLSLAGPPLSIKSSNDSKHISFGHRLLNLLNFSASDDVISRSSVILTTTLYENSISIDLRRSMMRV